MIARYILTDYVEQALQHAEYDKLDDGSFAGRIPAMYRSSGIRGYF